MKRQHTSGFSLLELLTVIGLLGVVMTLGGSAFIQFVGGWKTVQIRTLLHGRADNALASLEQDFGHLVSTRLSGVPMRGESRSYEDDTLYWRMQVEDDLLVLPVEIPPGVDGLRQYSAVMYHIDRDQERPVLTRTYGRLEADVPEGATEALAEDVHGMRIEYYDGTEWHAQWEAPGMPRAVRVSLILMDITRPHEQIARTATYPVHVR